MDGCGSGAAEVAVRLEDKVEVEVEWVGVRVFNYPKSSVVSNNAFVSRNGAAVGVWRVQGQNW